MIMAYLLYLISDKKSILENKFFSILYKKSILFTFLKNLIPAVDFFFCFWYNRDIFAIQRCL